MAQEYLENNPNITWPDRVERIERSDPVLGGPGGPANVPHQTLADRTAYLKTALDKLTRELSYAVGNFNIDALTLRVEELEMLLAALKTMCEGHGNGVDVAIDGLEQITSAIAELRARIDALELPPAVEPGGNNPDVIPSSLFPFISHCS
jgi:hypothetical protein